MNAKRRMPKRVALYVRTSTANGQTTRNQERELQAVAERHGWNVVVVYQRPRHQRRQGTGQAPWPRQADAGGCRREVDMVAAWSVDRLGRSLTDLLEVLQELHAKGVDLYLHQQGLDTSTPSGRAMFQMLGVFAEFERAIIRERVMAGLAGQRPKGRDLGGPRLSRMTQPRSKRSEPPAPQVRASAPSRVTTALVSGRSRASPHERRLIAATKGATARPRVAAPCLYPPKLGADMGATPVGKFFPVARAWAAELPRCGTTFGGSAPALHP